MDPAPPDVPGYRIGALLGEGYGGRVYRAVHEALGRGVALKVLRPEALGDAAVRERLNREARLLVTTPHACLVPLLDADLAAPVPYLAFAFMAGGDLGRFVGGEERMEEAEVVRVGARVAAALAALHDRGAIHRDLKPENVLVDGAGVPFLGDLGLGRGEDSDALTRTGTAVGTLGYMAPEVVLGEEATPASDLFGLGATLAALATGSPPDPSDDEARFPEEALAAIRPPELVPLLRACLRVDPEDRPPGARELQRDLAALLPGAVTEARATPTAPPEVPPVRAEPAPPRGPLLGATAAALLASAMLGRLLAGGAPPAPPPVERRALPPAASPVPREAGPFRVTGDRVEVPGEATPAHVLAPGREIMGLLAATPRRAYLIWRSAGDDEVPPELGLAALDPGGTSWEVVLAQGEAPRFLAGLATSAGVAVAVGEVDRARVVALGPDGTPGFLREDTRLPAAVPAGLL